MKIIQEGVDTLIGGKNSQIIRFRPELDKLNIDGSTLIFNSTGFDQEIFINSEKSILKH